MHAKGTLQNARPRKRLFRRDRRDGIITIPHPTPHGSAPAAKARQNVKSPSKKPTASDACGGHAESRARRESCPYGLRPPLPPVPGFSDGFAASPRPVGRTRKAEDDRRGDRPRRRVQQRHVVAVARGDATPASGIIATGKTNEGRCRSPAGSTRYCLTYGRPTEAGGIALINHSGHRDQRVRT